MIVIKVLIFCFNFSGIALDVQAGTRRKSMLNTCKTLLHRWLRRLMRLILRKKPIDVEQTHDRSILVGIGREILMLLKCILALVF